ncbi:MAG: FliA/WhiG family RNA polymerase sigma factor, partial [Desulfobacterales bacterium]|nr:FliA/WhiG family RNA polymerase sigma factor [Desulfobacterales bacterium]
MFRNYQERDKTITKQASGIDKKEREALIVKYAYLVKHIAGKIAVRLPSSVLFDELVSAGCLGLIDAIDKYDQHRDVNIKTYAQYRIKGAILDELRNKDVYSRSMRKKIQDVEKAIKYVEKREGRPASEDEVASEMGIELEKYQKMLGEIHSAAVLNLDEFIRSDEKDSTSTMTYQDQIRSEDNPLENISRDEMKKVLAEAIQKLSKNEQLVISLYYYEDLTLKEIGSVLELTESRICQIHTMALIKLKS